MQNGVGKGMINFKGSNSKYFRIADPLVSGATEFSRRMKADIDSTDEFNFIFLDTEISISGNFHMLQNSIVLFIFSDHLKMDKTVLVCRPWSVILGLACIL
jgi:hypothetical protein